MDEEKSFEMLLEEYRAQVESVGSTYERYSQAITRMKEAKKALTDHVNELKSNQVPF